MDNHKKNPDILEKLFRQMPEEELPASFRLKIMQQIAGETVKARKRNERFGLAAVIAASLGMLGMAVVSILYYIGLPETTGMQLNMPKIAISAVGFFFYLGILAMLLRLLDYKFRKAFRKEK